MGMIIGISRNNGNEFVKKIASLALAFSKLSFLQIKMESHGEITDKAQALTNHASKWHVCATIESFAIDISKSDSEFPVFSFSFFFILSYDNMQKSMISLSQVNIDETDTNSTQNIILLMTYLENNRAGITILGFTVDRAWLHTIFIYAGNYFVPVVFGQDNWDLLKPPVSMIQIILFLFFSICV
ncbi:unnamed protein product [Musa acuminata subsp. malaccensis]|uniref:(wild Malaysian banana) hypothetical protein n=1 Tax=Musa acuminata subsp. malaccensis TaxID=214687 RepID=A0A804I749_MUSAM|nr:unnamed protein product [Musa acuminata subsp. malaccensis]